MIYRVVITDGAFRRLRKYAEYLAIDKQAPLNAERWLRKALAATDTLATFPNRCPVAPENIMRPYTIRALQVDSQVFLYRVDDDSRVVTVFAFRGGAEQPRPHDLPKG